MTKEQLRYNIERLLARNAEQSDRFNYCLGMEVLDCDTEGPGGPWVEYSYVPKTLHQNPYGGVHGGIISSLVDTCGGTGAVALTDKAVTTTDLSVSFLRACNGARYVVRMEYTHVGRKLVSTIAKMIDADTGELCATGMLTYMALEGKPIGLRV